MKIIIWEQFSSNHSADYTVVGLFDSPDEASNAAEIIRKIIVDIVAWYDQHREFGMPFEDQQSAVEKHVAKQYGFDWQESVDWLMYFPSNLIQEFLRDSTKHIFSYDRLLFIEAPTTPRTKQTGHQFTKIIQSTGGSAFRRIRNGKLPDVRVIVEQTIFVTITCQVKNPHVAAMIIRELELHLRDRDVSGENQYRIPWVIFHEAFAIRTGGLSIEAFKRLEDYWNTGYQAWSEWLVSHPHEQPPRPRHEFLSMSNADQVLLISLRREVRIGNVEVEQVGNTIILKNLFGHVSTLLPAFLTWLYSLGCTDITYTFDESEPTIYPPNPTTN